MDKMKTREELLAEERDYKRRRMSYRGKKVKRTPRQVRAVSFSVSMNDNHKFQCFECATKCSMFGQSH